MVQATIIADIRDKGFQLVSVAEPDLLADDASRKLMRQIFGAIAEYDRAMVVAKLKAARERVKAKTGRCEGRKPFGFYEDEQPSVQRMRQLRAEGMGYDRIAAMLNAEGFKPRDGQKWWGKTVNIVLAANALQSTQNAWLTTNTLNS